MVAVWNAVVKKKKKVLQGYASSYTCYAVVLLSPNP
jgi:hypothetical protein